MSIILPILSTVVLFGSTFDLRRYELRPFQIYRGSDVSKYVKVTNINTFTSEFFVVDTPIELRKTLNVDIATGLKAAVSSFPYQFRNYLDYTTSDESDVRVLLKLTMRTVNESLPYNTPTIGNWKAKGAEIVGSHYVKSILYGADYFIILSVFGQNRQHRNNISEDISSTLGKSGIFDSSFKEKFDAVVEKHKADYGIVSSFGTGYARSRYFPPSTVNDALVLKDNFEEGVRAVSGNKGYKIEYEMQSLSILDSKFPSVEINSEMLNILELVELKYQDISVAFSEYLSWVNNVARRFTTEDEAQVEKFDLAINNANEAMEVAINDVDLTGDIDQFDGAFKAYGEADETTKYRSWLNRLKQNIKS